MAKRFLRLNLSASARDFEPVAVEPGLPLLDKLNANYRILWKWLGRLIAEPEWHHDGDSVDLFVCDDQQGRLGDVKCEPANTDDLRRNRELNQDLRELAKRLREIQPEPKEARLHEAITRHFGKLTTEVGPTQRQCHFFKYRDAGVWRLVWGWGYQRKDLAPASPTICTNPSCDLLFVRHSEGSRNCPDCEAASAETPVKPRKSWVRRVALLGIVALLAGVVGYAIRELWPPTPVLPRLPSGLAADPEQWVGPAGSQVEFVVTHRAAEEREEDVSTQVIAFAENPKIVRLDDVGTTGHALAPGKTAVFFLLGDKDTHSTVEVKPPENPARITLEPAEVTLGVGTTRQLRVWGETDGAQKVDLTGAAEWEPAAGGNVYCYRGLAEGVAAGETTVLARYRATPSDPYLEANAAISVVDEEYRSLELAVRPTSFSQKSAARLEAGVITDSGQKRSVLGSSQLAFQIDPTGLAVVEGEYLRAARSGAGSLQATFGGLSATRAFQVEKDLSPGPFIVRPKELRLIVGETAELQVISPSTDPIQVVSSAPGVVEVLSGCRVAGRALGNAEITVSQEARMQTIPVEVTPAEIKSIAFVPDRVSVPVDGSVPLRLVGYCDQGQIDFAPDWIAWEQIPTSTFADLDLKTLQIRGRRPTGVEPQTLTARYGELRATALVDVVAPPLRIELTPTGPVALPVGTVARLYPWAEYGDGRRVELSPARVQWKLDPADVSEIELDQSLATVRATKAGAGPVMIRAGYQGFDSNPVEFRSVGTAISLALEADRSLILVDDTGQLRASITDDAALHLSIEGVRFESSDAEVLAVDARNGAYRAMAPGKVTVTANHPQAKAPAQRELSVVPRDQANLVVRPAKVTLMVDGRQPLELCLVAGDKEDKVSFLDEAHKVEMAIARPESVQWRPPVLVGSSPAEPFEVAASYAGKTARAVVEVLPPSEKPEIRGVPATASLAPTQPLSPRVEQRLPGSGDEWQEIDPLKVRWNVPETVIWTPPSADLRPQLTLAESAKGKVKIEAEYRGSKATLTIDVKTEKPPSGPLVVVREPDGEELPVGSRQRYTVMVQDGARQERAADVKWQPAFENDYVQWEPPVLRAKKPGHEQQLTASAGSQKVVVVTRTVQPPGPPPPPAPPTGKPDAVHIVSGQTQPITIPVRARFADFRVEAVFPGAPPRDLTRQATLHVESEDPQQVPVAVEEGRLCGQRPGKAVVQAEYNGVRSAEGLRIEVVDELELTSMEIEPATVGLKVGESVDLCVKGFTGSGADKKLVGDITSRRDLAWKSENPDVIETNGPNLTARKEGKARVTVTSGSLAAGLDVTVFEQQSPLPPGLVLWPKSLRLKVGETKWFGRDVTLTRGGVDLIGQSLAASSAPSIVRYNRDNRSLEGVSPGEAEVAITYGGERFSLPVEVGPPDGSKTGSIVIEPAVDTLAVGESQDLHVFLVTDAGQRIDRTGSALLESSNPGVLAVSGNRVTGIAAGKSEATARLPGIDQPGKAFFTVAEEPFTELTVIPPALRLAVGEERSIQIFGVGPGGRRALSDHPDLKTAPVGDRPDAIEMRGATRVRGASPGKAAIQVNWRNLAAQPVPVEVSLEPPTMLLIEPREAIIGVGDRARFQVFAKQGDRLKPVGVDDGVELRIADPSVARRGSDLSVIGTSPGITEVTAQLGPQRAVARLSVIPVGPRPPDSRLPIGLRFIPDVLTLQLGVPGASVRVVKVLPDGTETDVDHRAKIDVTTPGIVDVNWTASGPVFKPTGKGRTQATASHENLTTRRPLQIQVVDPSEQHLGSQPRLEARPDPFHLTVGGTGEFRQVQLVPQGGGLPIDVDYRVQSKDTRIVAVEGGKALRGVASGQAQVTVSPVGVGEQYADLSTDVTVEVEGDRAGLQLVLTGPSQTAVGAEAKYQAELAGGGYRRDVTHDGAVLVLDRDPMDHAEVKPGCILVAKKPGTVNVRARCQESISNVLQLQISPVANVFDRLELDVARPPLSVGEVRPYKLWGHPAGGSPRQDLTGQITAAGQGAGEPGPRVAFRVVEPADGTEIVSHTPPTLVARSPGRFQLAASFGPDLRSDIVDLEILESPVDGDLRAVPSSITLRVGEGSPPIRVTARPRTGGPSRDVDAQWSSENEKIVAPDPKSAGQFVGRELGKTRLRAAFGNLEAFVDVTVVGDVFERVTIGEEPEFLPGNRFAVNVEVEASGHQDAGLEYRAVTPGNPDEGDWKAAAASGNRMKVQLTSPAVRLGPKGTVYHLLIEARDKQQKTVARHPESFRLQTRD